MGSRFVLSELVSSIVIGIALVVIVSALLTIWVRRHDASRWRTGVSGKR